jgi:hypothetical protein
LPKGGALSRLREIRGGPFEACVSQVGKKRLVPLRRLQQPMPPVFPARQGLGVEVAADDAGLAGRDRVKRPKQVPDLRLAIRRIGLAFQMRCHDPERARSRNHLRGERHASANPPLGAVAAGKP